MSVPLTIENCWLAVSVDGTTFRARYKWSYLPYDEVTESMGCRYNRWVATSSTQGPALTYAVYRTETEAGNPMVPKLSGKATR